MSSLGLTSNPMLGSIHGDVLNANPATEDERNRLIEELKRRGKSTVISRSFPESELLYGKAIDVMAESDVKSGSDPASKKRQDLAILYSNRSLARYHLGKLEESESDARRATILNPVYSKAFWRCGQALGALQRHADALEVYEGGVLAAKNAGASTKAFQKEMEKCQQKIEEEQKLLETTTASAKVDGATPPETAPARSTADPIPESKATNTVKSISEKKKNEAGATKDSSSNKLFTKSDHVRGYKIVNGKKTSYFHNELSEDAKKLIGDIAPKKLERVDVEEEKKNNSSDDKTSVWNTAGTWEERDTSPWAKETLTQALLSAEYSLPLSSPQPGAVVKITNVKSLNGHASIASVRGKRRYMYEFSTTLEWEMDIPSDGNTCTGSIEFPDIDGTCDGEYEMTNYTVKSVGTAGGAAKHLLDRFVKNGGLKDVLTEKLNEWVTLFQST